MKNILISCLLLLMACKTPQKATSQVSANKNITTTIDNCPENGTCTLELISNKTLEFKTDEFGNLYPTINEGSKTILKYTFTKKPLENTADSNYTELIYAELDSPIIDVNLTNEQLQNVQLHYGRLCFCKGESGYFPIKNGNFSLTKTNKDSLKIDLNFSVKKIPQIISEIHQTVSLKSNETN
ncbi:hypothetical protein EC396_01390 [Lutibacter sp. HS1-25]|uniref:hypothetical protein n=1 Tax=Lutibacter sp. HS1-25 TaxID=2485000 RepID=UPI001010B7E5|nr:hypothetical protein [Lutibacter sp. HS1-25]RXP64653.1 hypothetical protein EC396_01390 [Lutibacter sp. HS1-25]